MNRWVKELDSHAGDCYLDNKPFIQSVAFCHVLPPFPFLVKECLLLPYSRKIYSDRKNEFYELITSTCVQRLANR
jgi:hypothetical protein